MDHAPPHHAAAGHLLQQFQNFNVLQQFGRPPDGRMALSGKHFAPAPHPQLLAKLNSSDRFQSATEPK